MSVTKIKSKELIKKIQDEIQKENKLNVFEVPTIESVVLNSGVGKFSSSEKNDIAELIENLTGEKSYVIASKKSIANFKLREGQTVGIVNTLRGDKAIDFLIQTIYLALPRTRDFRGIKNKGFDKKYKSYSFGIPSATIFPIIEKHSKIFFGLQITIVFKKPNKLNETFLQKLNFPFKK